MECSKEPAWQSNRLFEETNWRMLQDERLCDVTFLVGTGKEEKIMAHRFILASRSPVFFTKFRGSLPEASQTIGVPDIEPAIFHDLLRYIYTEDCSLNEHKAIALLYCSLKYELERLREACQKFLNKNISSDNVCTILQHAVQFDEADLENRCLTFVTENAETVLKSDGLSTLSKEVLKKIIESDELYVDELCVYNACKKWAIAQCNSKSDNHEHSELDQRRALGDLIYSVRFATMSFQTFAENVAIEDILTPEEKVFVFQTIAEKISKKSFPFQAISKNRNYSTKIVEVQRFRMNYSHHWIYCGNPDVLNFKVSIPCKIVGVSLFAPYEEGILEGTISLQNDTSVLIAGKNVRIIYEVSKYYENVLFDKPIDIEPERGYTIFALLKAEKTYYGKDGKVKVVSGPLEVVFSHNGNSTNETSDKRGQFHSMTFEFKPQH